MVDGDDAREQAGIIAVECDVTRAGLRQAGGVHDAVDVRPDIGGRSVHDGLARSRRAEDPVIGMRFIRKGSKDDTGGLARGGGSPDGDIESPRNGDIANAEGEDRGGTVQSKRSGDVGDLRRRDTAKCRGRRGRRVGGQYQTSAPRRDEAGSRSRGVVDDPRGDHAVARGEGRAVDVRDDQFLAGAEGRGAGQHGQDAGILAGQVADREDGIVRERVALLDGDERAALQVDRGDRLGAGVGGSGAGEADITAAEVDGGSRRKLDVRAIGSTRRVTDDEAGNLARPDTESGIEDIEGGIADPRSGTGIITLENELTGDIQGAADRNDVLQRGIRDLQRAVSVDGGAAVVILDVVQVDGAGGDTTEQTGAGERITDDQSRGAGKHVGRRDLKDVTAAARAEAIDSVIGTEGGRRVIGGKPTAAIAEEPWAITSGAAAGLGHVDRVGTPGPRQLQ